MKKNILIIPLILVLIFGTMIKPKAYQPPPSVRVGFTRSISIVPGEEFIIFGKNDNSTPDINTGLTIKMFQSYFTNDLSGVDYMDWPITWDWNGFKIYLDGELYSNTTVALVRYNYSNTISQTTLFFDINFNLILSLGMEDVSTYNSIELKRYINTGGYDSDDLQNAFDNGKDVGFDDGISYAETTMKPIWVQQAESDGYTKGLNDNVATGGFIMILSSAFIGVATVLGIELLPNITLGMIVAVPLVFGILFFILGKRKG